MGIILAIVLFSVIVIVHELGHFLLAKVNGIEVFEFSLGMGPTLISKRIGETLYCIKLLPLGGSCMMGEDAGDDETVELKGNFNEKSVWARIQVIVAGPVFNFILAWIFATIIVAWIGFDAPIISEVVEDSPAQEAGLLGGDEITEINGKSIYLWRDISSYIAYHDIQELTIAYQRDGVSYETTLTPAYDEESGSYLMGVISSGYIQDGSIIETLEYGVYTVRFWIATVIDSLRLMITGNVSMNEVSGVVGIVDIVDETYEQSAAIGWNYVVLNMMNLAVMLSANLGVMNLLPIPALDGGRLVFLVLEAIRGKRVSPEKEGFVHFIGFALLMLLMVVILFNDIIKLFA